MITDQTIASMHSNYQLNCTIWEADMHSSSKHSLTEWDLQAEEKHIKETQFAEHYIKHKIKSLGAKVWEKTLTALAHNCLAADVHFLY